MEGTTKHKECPIHYYPTRKGGQKTKETILRLIASNPSISSIEMAKTIGINRSAISKHLKKLKEEGIIERQGPAKGGIWKIR
ncbi:MAG TPA: hypothetical protein DDW28_10025 [Prevotella sp.]|nr:hypothetical protein [Candidatus Segatella violae]